MTTIAPTFHVQLSTTFPPFSTINDLEAEKRSFHRQRSTRRLEAARGTTRPPFLDLDSKTDIITMTNSPASPRSRAIRRKGQLFNSPSSSVSSTDSIESDYMFVNAQVQSDFQLHSPSSSTCSLSPAGNPVANGNSNRGILGKDKARNKAKTTKTEGPQPLAQPFLLQLRSLPVPPTATNIKPSNPPVTNNSKSLSSASSCFNMQSTTVTTFSRPHHVLSETEKRRKLAKLIHKFGENIPPELVFPSSTTTPTTPATTVWKTSSHRTSRSLLVAVPTPLLSPVPDHVAAAPTFPQSQSTEEPETRVEHQRRTRPRSMTTVPSPTMATTPSSRGKSFDRTSPPFQEITATFGPESRGDEISLEWGRRREKDWSGEWNVKDMDRVAKALRGLKAR
jgi:hypothetical protein